MGSFAQTSSPAMYNQSGTDILTHFQFPQDETTIKVLYIGNTDLLHALQSAVKHRTQHIQLQLHTVDDSPVNVARNILLLHMISSGDTPEFIWDVLHCDTWSPTIRKSFDQSVQELLNGKFPVCMSPLPPESLPALRNIWSEWMKQINVPQDLQFTRSQLELKNVGIDSVEQDEPKSKFAKICVAFQQPKSKFAKLCVAFQQRGAVQIYFHLQNPLEFTQTSNIRFDAVDFSVLPDQIGLANVLNAGGQVLRSLPESILMVESDWESVGVASLREYIESSLGAPLSMIPTLYGLRLANSQKNISASSPARMMWRRAPVYQNLGKADLVPSIKPFLTQLAKKCFLADGSNGPAKEHSCMNLYSFDTWMTTVRGIEARVDRDLTSRLLPPEVSTSLQLRPARDCLRDRRPMPTSEMLMGSNPRMVLWELIETVQDYKITVKVLGGTIQKLSGFYYITDQDQSVSSVYLHFREPFNMAHLSLSFPHRCVISSVNYDQRTRTIEMILIKTNLDPRSRKTRSEMDAEVAKVTDAALLRSFREGRSKVGTLSRHIFADKRGFLHDQIDNRICAYADGSALGLGSPQPVRLGLGVWWNQDHPENVAEPLAPFKGPHDNTTAEMSAATRLLELAKILGIVNPKLLTDSESVIKFATFTAERYLTNGWKNGNEVWKYKIPGRNLLIAMEGFDVDWVKVDAHVKNGGGHFGNIGADKLARTGAGLFDVSNPANEDTNPRKKRPLVPSTAATTNAPVRTSNPRTSNTPRTSSAT